MGHNLSQAFCAVPVTAHLPLWDGVLDKPAGNLQTTFSNTFSGVEIFVFQLKSSLEFFLNFPIVCRWYKFLHWRTVYPKKYAHGFCFAVLCCGYTFTDFPISIRLTSLALWQSNDCPSASKATLMNMDKYFMWIHYERLHNHNKAKHNKTVCIFLGIYCMMCNYLPIPDPLILSVNVKMSQYALYGTVFEHYPKLIHLALQYDVGKPQGLLL